MSHYSDGSTSDPTKITRAGILPIEQLTVHRIPSHNANHHHHHLTVESFLNSRACCKLLLFWSILTTLASMVSVFYAIDVHNHNSLIQKQEIRDAILNREFVSEKQTDLDGLIHRPRYNSINLFN
jgi:hypothetical protein